MARSTWLIGWIAGFLAWAQPQSQTLTLNQAIQIAQQQNIQAVAARTRVLQARKKVWETTAIGLPQIQLTGNYQYFIDLPVTPVPARIFNPLVPEDQYLYLKFGQDQKMEFGIRVTQLIFSGSYIVGIQSARTYQQISKLAEEKTYQELRKAVVQAYVNLALVGAMLSVVDSQLATGKQQLNELQYMHQEGLVDSLTVAQLASQVRLLEIERENLVRQRQVAAQMLNVLLGRSPDEPVQILYSLEALVEPRIDTAFNPQQHIDYRIALNQVRAQKLQVRYVQSQALPTISAFWMGSKYAYSGKTFDFFDSGKEWQWQSLVGVQVNFPIFTSGRRHAQYQQALLDYRLSQLKAEHTLRQLRAQFNKTYADYVHAYEKWLWSQQEVQLAEERLRQAYEKLKVGEGSSTDFLLARQDLYRAQQTYLQNLAQLVILQETLKTMMQ